MKTAIKKKAVKSKKAVKKKVSKEDDDIPDLSNDPYFVKKAEDAKAMLIRMGTIFED